MSKTWKDYTGPNLGACHNAWKTESLSADAVGAPSQLNAQCCIEEKAAREAWAVAQNEIDAIPLVVTINGKVAEDQAAAIQRFKDLCRAQPDDADQVGKVLASMDYSNETSKVAFLRGVTAEQAQDALSRAIDGVMADTQPEIDKAAQDMAATGLGMVSVQITQPYPRLLDGSGEYRKQYPMATGLLDYFPDALAEVARVSKLGNDKHNPGQPLHHARGKSMDHADCILRHLAGRGGFDGEMRESASLAWRALALLQEELEEELGLPLPRGASL